MIERERERVERRMKAVREKETEKTEKDRITRRQVPRCLGRRRSQRNRKIKKKNGVREKMRAGFRRASKEGDLQDERESGSRGWRRREGGGC